MNPEEVPKEAWIRSFGFLSAKDWFAPRASCTHLRNVVDEYFLRPVVRPPWLAERQQMTRAENMILFGLYCRWLQEWITGSCFDINTAALRKWNTVIDGYFSLAPWDRFLLDQESLNQGWSTTDLAISPASKSIRMISGSAAKSRNERLERQLEKVHVDSVLAQASTNLSSAIMSAPRHWEKTCYQRRRRLITDVRTFYTTPAMLIDWTPTSSDKFMESIFRPPDVPKMVDRKNIIIRPLNVRKKNGLPDRRLPDLSQEMIELFRSFQTEDSLRIFLPSFKITVDEVDIHCAKPKHIQRDLQGAQNKDGTDIFQVYAKSFEEAADLVEAQNNDQSFKEVGDLEEAQNKKKKTLVVFVVPVHLKPLTDKDDAEADEGDAEADEGDAEADEDDAEADEEHNEEEANEESFRRLIVHHDDQPLAWVYSDIFRQSKNIVLSTHQFEAFVGEPSLRKKVFQNLLLFNIMGAVGLDVCENPACLMNNCDSVDEMSEQAEESCVFCPTCLRKLQLKGLVKNVPEYAKAIRDSMHSSVFES